MKIIEVVETTTTVIVSEEEKPLRVTPRLIAAPRIRQLYWCDFPKDAQLPEFWKRRAVLVISYRNTLSGAVTVLPCSGQAQDRNPWAIPLQTFVDGVGQSWVICDKPTTVAVSRLSPDRGGIRRMEEAQFNPILAKLHEWLPKVP